MLRKRNSRPKHLIFRKVREYEYEEELGKKVVSISLFLWSNAVLNNCLELRSILGIFGGTPHKFFADRVAAPYVLNQRLNQHQVIKEQKHLIYD